MALPENPVRISVRFNVAYRCVLQWLISVSLGPKIPDQVSATNFWLIWRHETTSPAFAGLVIYSFACA